MHGGKSKGPKTKAGKNRARLAVLKHGRFTKEVKAEHRQVMELIRNCKDVLGSII